MKIKPGTLFKTKVYCHFHDKQRIAPGKIFMYVESLSYDTSRNDKDSYRYYDRDYDHWFLTASGKKIFFNCEDNIDEFVDNNKNYFERVEL
jgi:hypothetical protein